MCVGSTTACLDWSTGQPLVTACERERLSSFSNYGATNVDIAAPGTGILSTVPGQQYAYMDGTSMATP